MRDSHQQDSGPWHFGGKGPILSGHAMNASYCTSNTTQHAEIPETVTYAEGLQAGNLFN